MQKKADLRTLKNTIETIRFIFDGITNDNLTTDKAFELGIKNFRCADTEKPYISFHVTSLLQNWRLLTEIYSKLELSQSNNFYALFNIHCIIKSIPLPQSFILKEINHKKVLSLADSFKGKVNIECSLPDWIDLLGQQEIGSSWYGITKSLLSEAPLVIRTNSQKISRADLQTLLHKKGLHTRVHPAAQQALIFTQKTNVFRLPEFLQGYFEVQDISSQLVSQFLNPQPGIRVIDGCAGNGGKSLHLANLMENKGKIIALDIFQSKLDILKKRAKRAGSSLIETRLVDTTKVVKRLANTADAVLLDVPCSGLGVLKRNPDIKWRLTPSDFENIKNTQQEILNRYSQMVKPGGKLVYATCSIMPSENNLQIQSFLNQSNCSFEFVREQILSPELGYDGFYMAELKRKQ